MHSNAHIHRDIAADITARRIADAAVQEAGAIDLGWALGGAGA